MSLWTKPEIIKALSDPDSGLSVAPLISTDQVNEVSVDLRLGYDFLVSVHTRAAFIDVSAEQQQGGASLASHFDETRRRLGDTFILYPDQLVLATTLEYVGLPANCYADVMPRSSYSKLGVGLYAMLQPGYRGCVPLELLNHGNVPVRLTVGARICQMRLTRIAEDTDYHAQSQPRKYYGQVRPAVSKASVDEELIRLTHIRENIDNR
ncbi:dCTP deaminase [Undibacterium crateris]|uniref:dCTP deaminase n=1 Tax=Undibacterium crateris TaxID=2528175 RepID=UPI001389DF98|nr:dCTP deaminase [Undibacterium crateris]NDI85472.1 dCTP deaminase [Undibacterium crateris]